MARQAFLDFGKGRHPTALNFGDCFAYALARECYQPGYERFREVVRLRLGRQQTLEDAFAPHPGVQPRFGPLLFPEGFYPLEDPRVSKLLSELRGLV